MEHKIILEPPLRKNFSGSAHDTLINLIKII